MSSIDLKIDLATAKEIEEHLTQCSQLFHPTLDSYVAIPEYAQKLRDNSVTFEAWCDQVLVGLIACYLNDYDSHQAFISSVSVCASFHGKGVARDLLRKALKYALEKGFEVVILEVKSRNLNALCLYKSLGFVVTEQNCDSFVMKMTL